jgi:hypothetical protein
VVKTMLLRAALWVEAVVTVGIGLWLLSLSPDPLGIVLSVATIAAGCAAARKAAEG